MSDAINKLNLAVCDALKLDIAAIKSITIKLSAGVPTVEVVHLIKDDAARRLAEVLVKYDLVAKTGG